MAGAESKKLDQLIIMLADVRATFGDRFDQLGDRFAKHDRRPETIADRLPGVEKKVSGIGRHLDSNGCSYGATDHLSA